MSKIVAGLGNPGNRFVNTKHNAGFLLVDEITDKEGIGWKEYRKFKALMAEYDDLKLVKPQTGMNRSGDAVSKVLSYYKHSPEDLVVIHDDVDFPTLSVKKQFGKKSAGHKGVEDIIEKLGTNEFWRVRVGVGRPKEELFDVEEYVLSRFSEDELARLKQKAAEIFSIIKQS